MHVKRLEDFGVEDCRYQCMIVLLQTSGLDPAPQFLNHSMVDFLPGCVLLISRNEACL